MALKKVTTVQGIVEGVPGANPSFTVFKGIPYAAPPVGRNRWREPQPAEHWNGIYRANAFKGICPQNVAQDAKIFQMDNPYPFEKISEDCLYLNVWTPACDANEKLPVLFAIHGGANVTGFGHQMCFDGEAFCKQNCILVTFTWRVNVFGWLTHKELSEESEHHVSGNYGIFDQIAALHWTRENIAAFGGDPENITIMGESAGGSSVFSLCLTPLTKGMFKHAIMQSGGGYDIFARNTYLSLKQMEDSMDLKKLLGVESIAEARELSDEEVERRINRPEAMGAYLPMQAIDGYVFPYTFDVMCKKHLYHKVDYIIGYTKDESFMYVYPNDRDQFIADQKREYGELADQYLDLCQFLNDDRAFKNHLFVRNAEMLKTAAINFAETLEENGDKAYVYCFTRDLGDGYGAYHSSELWYLYGTLLREGRDFRGADFELSKAMTSYWSNFAKSGNPNGEGLAEWTPYTKAEPLTMDLGVDPGMKDFGVNERILFRKKFVRGELD